MLRVVVVSAALLPVLGGCVSQVQLADNKGQMAQCSAAGLGIVSSLVAASVQQTCIDQYQKQGYHQLAAAAPSAAAATSTATASQASKSTAAAPAATKTAASAKPRSMQCNVFGMGLAGSLIAASMQQTCIAQHSAAAPAAPSGQATQK
jgi:hypothetical protein